MEPTVALIAHNIRSLWNVGTFFRNADCLGVDTIYLTGYTATPPRKEISKTAIGAEEWIDWKYVKDPIQLIDGLKKKNFEIVALEKTKQSICIQDYEPTKPIALIVGHEVLGVSKELLESADTVVHIPQVGKKESLNVSVACGVALYALRNNS